MKKIFLISGPSRDGYSKKVGLSLKENCKRKNKISFIASSPSNHEKNLKYVYGNEEITGIVDFLREYIDINDISIVDDNNKSLDINSDIIYLLGGNYETQLTFLKENHFDEVLKTYSGVIIGTSCGAMNLAKNAYYSKDDECKESFFYQGIGLVNITIDPHFDILDDEQVNEAINMSHDIKIYGVPNDSGIFVNNEIVNYIGIIYEISGGKLEELKS